MKGVSSAHAANSISRLLISPAIPPPCQNPRRRRTDFAGAVASLVLSFACLIAVVHSKNPHQSEEHGSEKCVEVSEHTLEFLNERNGRGWSHRACQRAGDSKQDKEAKGVDQTCSNIDTKWDLQLIEQSFSRCAVVVSLLLAYEGTMPFSTLTSVPWLSACVDQRHCSLPGIILRVRAAMSAPHAVCCCRSESTRPFPSHAHPAHRYQPARALDDVRS